MADRLEKSSSKRLIWEVIRLLEECGKITMPRFYPERATSLASGLVSGLAEVQFQFRLMLLDSEMNNSICGVPLMMRTYSKDLVLLLIYLSSRKYTLIFLLRIEDIVGCKEWIKRRFIVKSFRVVRRLPKMFKPATSNAGRGEVVMFIELSLLFVKKNWG
ncbi:hypothetical protein Dsin_013083 [Dipteronia sinensis]|uniref:Uncharacterized protein n=1 Tax=Dipteronia sinensis TaxID=43782 RepID=A0AAE0E8J6_9ROSI|nr:hypothetical protein Dsin_013083 [Dipteronia sinensis]